MSDRTALAAAAAQEANGVAPKPHQVAAALRNDDAVASYVNYLESEINAHGGKIDAETGLVSWLRAPKAQLAVNGLASCFRGEDDGCGLPDVFDKLASFEPVDVTLNAGIIRCVLDAASIGGADVVPA